MSPLGSLGGFQLTRTIPDTLVFTTVTVLGDELGATTDQLAYYNVEYSYSTA